MDNIEREVKVLGVELNEVEDRLKDLGAVFIKSEYQTNYVYDNKERDLECKGGYLRIRISKEEDKKSTTLTYKEILNVSDLRENLELNLEIENDQIKTIEQILEKLGYFNVATGHKHRIRYNYRNYIIDLDKWDKDTYPDGYIEIEMRDNFNEDDFRLLLKELKIKGKYITTKSIRELKNNF